MKAGCGTCQYRHECFPAHFVLPPTQAEAAVKSFWTNPKVRSHLPYAMLAASLAGTGWLVWSEHDRLAALLERHLGVHFPLTTTTTTTSPSSETTELDRQRVWDQLSSRPEILNSFLFCSCGCGEKVDFNKGEFELKAGRVFNRAHFRCNGCGKHLEGTTTSSAGAHEHEEDGWVFHKEGKLYCVYDFMDRFCDTCAGCGRTLGDQLAVDPRLGCAFCVDCFQASGDDHKVERHFGIVERVETQSQGDKLMREVKTWLSQEMGIQFAGADGDIPLSLYRPEKIEHLHGSGKKHHRKEQADDQIGSTLGLTVKQVSRVSLFAKKYTPTEVILVKGLSQEHAGAVLAHEMMHCWIALYLSQKTELPEEVEEGLCELMSYLWLVHKNRPAALPAPETKTSAEVEYLLARMERNWANAQGRGFHRAITSLQTHEDGNLRLLLAHARQHANLPAPLPSL